MKFGGTPEEEEGTRVWGHETRPSTMQMATE